MGPVRVVGDLPAATLRASIATEMIRLSPRCSLSSQVPGSFTILSRIFKPEASRLLTIVAYCSAVGVSTAIVTLFDPADGTKQNR